LARAEFGGLEGADLLAGVSSWVGVNIAYVAGSSRPIDGAVATLLGREGVCRDFAHLTAALLRANNVAARVVSVYAPGLTPMDFHVVTEACIDGGWYVVDPTCLAPREAMVRIATGADASGVAFITTLRGVVELDSISSWMSARGCLEDQRREPLYPAVDDDVIDLDATLDQQFFDIAVRQAIAQVPPDGEHDHVRREPEANE
jgi:transglutaminase-like putative cysteine protease